MKALYGPEYPEAIMISGVRIPLERETRFARHYYSKDGKAGGSVSKFQDGTVALTLQQLQNEWSEWSKQERQGFCSECSWLGAQSDFPDMLRFIMRHGEPDHWRDIALCVAHHLPQDEGVFWILCKRVFV